MKLFLILSAAAVALVLLAAYVCFYLAFYVPRRKPAPEDEFEIPPGKIYEPHRVTMVQWMKEVRQMPCQEFSITSYDGLRLSGKFYEYAPGAPIEIMFHGYRGSAERDLCGGVQRCFSMGCSVLLVDQRTSGKSQGNVITFGVKEQRDCLSWVYFAVQHFGKDVKLILTGISMGASTVLLASRHPLPENVIGVIADCGFTSARAIIKKVIRQLKLPANLLYPFVRLGAKLYGGFDPEEASALDAVQKSTVPILFIHGENDDFVPCEMTRESYAACASPKLLLTVPDAGHGLSYMVDTASYMQSIEAFSKLIHCDLSPQK